MAENGIRDHIVTLLNCTPSSILDKIATHSLQVLHSTSSDIIWTRCHMNVVEDNVMLVICKASDSHDTKMLSLKQDNSEWHEIFLYWLPFDMKWIKVIISTCTSMLNLQYYWVVAHPDYPHPLVCFIFPNLCFAWNNTDRVLYMRAYLSTSVYKWVGMHTLIFECTPQFRILPIHGLSHSSSFFCQYYFSFASLHFLNVPRMGSRHIQHLGLGVIV